MKKGIGRDKRFSLLPPCPSQSLFFFLLLSTSCHSTLSVQAIFVEAVKEKHK